jgi:dephospho-CoA kinase
MPYCIGLTGGIGSGKSSAAQHFKKLGAGVIDVDDISHDLTKPGGAGMAPIQLAFGADFVAKDGSLDRVKMRELVFKHPEQKIRLETILHPLIGQQALSLMHSSKDPYVLLVVPLLFEKNTYLQYLQRIAVVDCSEKTQIERTMKRSHLTESSVREIMAAQISRSERLAHADDILNNDEGPEQLNQQVLALHLRYIDLANKLTQ